MCVIVGVLFYFIIRELDGTIPRKRRFLDRAELSPDEFYQQYYESSGLPKDKVIEIRNFIAHEIEIPAALLRPTDRFSEELKPDAFSNFDDGLAVVEMELDYILRKKGLRQAPDIKNMDDYIRCIIALGSVEPESYQSTKGTFITAALAVLFFLIYLLKGNLWVAFIWLIIFIIVYYASGKLRGAG
ncbi:MAG: hypothetical protein HQK98_04260 [Nitrospirae bacterium]|nr:hypothetical protein [Nitrospirota bacterium]